MKDYKRLTKNDWHNAKFSVITHKEHRAVLHRLWYIENRIESGEIDYVSDRDNEIERLTAELERCKRALRCACRIGAAIRTEEHIQARVDCFLRQADREIKEERKDD